jgi:hypothetical protein
MKQFFIILAILFSVSAIAQDTLMTSYISVELDPAPFILGGYSFSIKYSPKKMQKTAFMASVYSSDFPNSMMSNENQENGWTNLKLEASYAVFAEFYLKNKRRGFYYGPSIFLYDKSVELSSINERTRFRTLYPNLRAGYVWYPFKKVDLYLNPWFNIGSEINIDNKNSLNGIDYQRSKFNYILALHIGYSFNW